MKLRRCLACARWTGPASEACPACGRGTVEAGEPVHDGVVVASTLVHRAPRGHPVPFHLLLVQAGPAVVLAVAPADALLEGGSRVALAWDGDAGFVRATP